MARPSSNRHKKDRQRKQRAASVAHSVFRRGDLIPSLTIQRLGINGEGVAYYKKHVVFVEGALPEEVVTARITEVEPSFARAEVVRIKQPSPHRVEPVCSVYEQCGGCQLQHMDTEGQLKGKEEMVRQAFEKYVSAFDPRSSDSPPLPLRPIAGMDDPWHYRNKAQLQVGTDAEGKVITGLYAKNSHRLIDLSSCPVQHPRTNEMIQVTRDVLHQLHIPIYDERKRSGVVRTIVARIGIETEESQLVLVTATDRIPRQKELLTELRYRLPYVNSIVQNVNPHKTSLIFGDETRVLWGKETIEERLGKLEFSLSPRSFFQLNPVQTVKLYDYVKEAAALTGREKVVDAYCGVGTIGLWLASDAAEFAALKRFRRRWKTHGKMRSETVLIMSVFMSAAQRICCRAG